MTQKITQKIFLKAVRLYQLLISPLLGPRCKFYPSCSEYSILAIREHGILKGIVLSCWRILRCAPWSEGGVDLP